MNILIYSPSFYPNVGGLETVISILAHEFFERGHKVKLVSEIPDPEAKVFPFEVYRSPSFTGLLELTQWCNIYFQGCVSLKGLWPLLIIRKPLVVSHHTWYRRLDGSLGWQDHIKRFVTRFATNISASRDLAEEVPAPSTVVPNPYRADIFHKMPEITRDREIVFLGRLVSDKGVDLLLDALAEIKQRGMTPNLTIIGKGPEESRLHQQVKKLDLTNQVNFVGVKVGKELARLLNAHQIIVVPSRWREPFGVVALEGIACGCVAIGSERGGLKDAIGPCGVTFPNGDSKALTQVLFDLLSSPGEMSLYRTQAESHLSKHKQAEVAKAYLQIFERVVR